MIYIKRILALVVALACALVFSVGVSAFEDVSDSHDRISIAIDRLTCAFEHFEDNIDLTDLGIAPSELGYIFSAATKNSPYLFYVSNTLSYTYKKGGGVVCVTHKYLYSSDEASEMVSFCKGEVTKIADTVRSGESDLERVLAIHDLICRFYSYDLTLESNNIYYFLKTGRGTCQGYTWTYMALLRELGIECEYVASDTIGHIWVKVKIDGEWYNSDVTWDDPVSSEKDGARSYAHFLFSDEKAEADGYVDRYCASGIICSSTKYDGVDFSGYLSADDPASTDNMPDAFLLKYNVNGLPRRIYMPNLSKYGLGRSYTRSKEGPALE